MNDLIDNWIKYWINYLIHYLIKYLIGKRVGNKHLQAGTRDRGFRPGSRGFRDPRLQMLLPTLLPTKYLIK